MVLDSDMASQWTTRKRVLILDDEPAARALLQSSLACIPDSNVETIEVATHRQCQDVLARTPFHLCLMDLVLEEGMDLATIQKARQANPEATILVVSSLMDEEVVLAAICAGANGYVSKFDHPREIAHAIDVALNGGASIGPVIAARIIEMFKRQNVAKQEARDLPSLTMRESEILREAARGLDYVEIAEKLNIKSSTVYTHVRHIYEKLQVNNLAQALYIARKQQLV